VRRSWCAEGQEKIDIPYLEEMNPISRCCPWGRLETTENLCIFGIPADIWIRLSKYKPEALWPDTVT
jgi:hypothetical protein